MRRPAALLVVLAASASSSAHAQATSSPFEREVRRHAYAVLHRSPWRALGYELLFPGAGSFYTGLHAAGAISTALSLAGAGMWIAGARRDRDALMWTGVAAFATGRAHGLVSAPLGAALLNAAFRRQLGVSASF